MQVHTRLLDDYIDIDILQQPVMPASKVENNVAIGIDLGTTNSCVAVVQNGVVEIIRNEQGQRTTPSCVSFTEEGTLVGSPAFEQLASNPKNTIFGAKRIIGKDFNDPDVKWDTQYCPYKVVNRNGHPVIEVESLGENKEMTPEEISAKVLTKMKEIAESYLGHVVKNVVITVPAKFTDSQRQATKDAARIADLNILHLLNEPTAAAIAYGLQNKRKENMNILVYDLGGGTFDVSILTIKGKEFEVRATTGNNRLGGDDFDTMLVEHFVGDFMEKHKKDLNKDHRALLRLRTKCEFVKCTLSDRKRAVLELAVNGIEYNASITREMFETLCANKFGLTMDLVKDALTDAKMTKDEIDDVVLVGGSTRIPKIQELLSHLFAGKSLKQSINPDEAVAYGAAIQAGILSDGKTQIGNEIRLKDVVAMTLGVETVGRVMTNVVARNTHIPTKATEDFTTAYDNQVAVRFKVFQGESEDTSGNTLLGEFTLDDLPPQSRGVPAFEVTFSIDVDGILTVSAKDKTTGQHKAITITTLVGRLHKEAFERIKRRNEKEMKRTLAMKNFETATYKMVDELNGLAVAPEKSQAFKGKCDQITKLLGAGAEERANTEKMQLEKDFRQMVATANT